MGLLGLPADVPRHLPLHKILSLLDIRSVPETSEQVWFLLMLPGLLEEGVHHLRSLEVPELGSRK